MNYQQSRVTAVILSFLLIAPCISGADMVTDGLATAEFVVSEQAEKVERFAIEDIQYWIEEMSGAKVPIVNAPTPKENVKIYVGKAFAVSFAEDLEKLSGTDGFAIRSVGTDIYVFADRPRGVAFGLFAFLEKNTDIIWARPNSTFGTVFGKNKTITLTSTDCLEIPVFPFRCFTGGHPPHKEGAEWMIRNGINRAGRRQFDGPGWDMVTADGSNLYRNLKSQYEEHPEWFGYDPITKGRVCGAGEGTLCLSQPGLPEIWANATIAEILKREAIIGRKMETYIIGPGDNWFCCCCPDCLRPLKLADGSTLTMKDPDSVKDPLFRSTQYQIFINEAMKTLKVKLPHVKFCSLAYIHLAEPPAVEIDPDLLVFFAPYPSNSMRFSLLDPRQPYVWRERFQKWQVKTKKLGFYEYFFSKPSPQGYYASENLKALLKKGDQDNAFIYTEYTDDRDQKGLIGIGSQGWDVGAMNTWVIAKLFWDPNQDVDALYKYYIKRTYREAAGDMAVYFELIRDSWLDPANTVHDTCHAPLAGVYKGMVLDWGIESKVNQALANAEKASVHPHSRIMIQRMRTVIASYKKGMSRLEIAAVEEMAHDGDTFASVQWEKPVPLDAFHPINWIGDIQDAPERTELKAAHDGSRLYLRLTAFDSKVDRVTTIMPEEGQERWPKGDHAEIWFAAPYQQPFVFAFDSQGNKYDAKGYDRGWNSGWRIITQKSQDRWEAIAIIPMESLGLKSGEETKLGWFCEREMSHESETPVRISYQGQPLYRKFFPIVVD